MFMQGSLRKTASCHFLVNRFGLGADFILLYLNEACLLQTVTRVLSQKPR